MSLLAISIIKYLSGLSCYSSLKIKSTNSKKISDVLRSQNEEIVNLHSF